MVTRKIAWGAKVSAEFKEKAIAISNRLRCNVDDPVSCMAFAGSGFPSANGRRIPNAWLVIDDKS
jgi:hypothetical protein